MFDKLTAGALLMLISCSAAAHSIFLECENAGENINCKGSFSDGSVASDLPFEVISYEDELLLSGRSDDRSSFSFPAPAGEYFILLDAGPGHVIELDMLDIQ